MSAAPTLSRPSPSYWQLALRDFRANRLALAATIIVFFIVTVAVFAPVLANNRPLYLNAVLSEEYSNLYYAAYDAAKGLAGEEGETPTVEAIAVNRTNLGINLDAMAGHVSGADSKALGDLAAAMKASDALAPGFDRARHEKALAAFESALSPDAEPKKVQVLAVTRYPALRALENPEIFFMAFYFSSLAALLFLRRRIRSLPRFLAFTLGISFGAVLLLRMAVPSRTDTAPYRTMLEDKDFKGTYWSTVIPFGENENITEDSRTAPATVPGFLKGRLPGTADNPAKYFHALGTDTNGRDVLARMVYGTRISMLIGLVAVSLYVTIGIILGALAGYFRGWIDLLLSRVIEVVICFPSLFVILSVQAFLPPHILNIMVTLGLLYWTGVARLQRGEFLRLVELDFVAAVRALGGSNLRIIFLHILPNALGPILVLVSFGIAGSILTESALSFLGFGVPQPAASWGDLLNNGRSDIQGTWWLTVFPGMAIFVTVTCFNLMGEGVRDALDPRRG